MYVRHACTRYLAGYVSCVRMCVCFVCSVTNVYPSLLGGWLASNPRHGQLRWKLAQVYGRQRGAAAGSLGGTPLYPPPMPQVGSAH